MALCLNNNNNTSATNAHIYGLCVKYSLKFNCPSMRIKFIEHVVVRSRLRAPLQQLYLQAHDSTSYNLLLLSLVRPLTTLRCFLHLITSSLVFTSMTQLPLTDRQYHTTFYTLLYAAFHMCSSLVTLIYIALPYPSTVFCGNV